MFRSAQELSNLKDILFDRQKFFKSEYETLPIPNLDHQYFHKRNTIDMMDYNSVLGAIFICYKQDLYVLENANFLAFFREKENKTLKRIKVLEDEDESIDLIKMSPCNHMIAIVVNKVIKIYSIKKMMLGEPDQELTSFTGMNNWAYIRWAPNSDLMLGIDTQQTLYAVNLKEGKEEFLKDHKITCADFTRDSKNIVAINNKIELLVVDAAKLEDIKKTDKLGFIGEDERDKFILTNIQEGKPNQWLIQGGANDSESIEETSRHTFMIEGDIVNKKIAELKVIQFKPMFMPLTGADFENGFVPPYFKTHYIPQRDVFLCGNSESNGVNIVINKPGTLISDPDIMKYASPDRSITELISLKTPPQLSLTMMARLRGFVFYINKLYDTDMFEFQQNDEDKQMPYPPFVIVLTSCGQLARYAFLDMRPDFSKPESSLIIPILGLSALQREIQLKNFAEAGIFDPLDMRVKDTLKRVEGKKNVLEEAFKTMAKDIEECIFEPIKKEDNEFFSRWRTVEADVYKCKESIAKFRSNFRIQDRIREYWDKVLSDLDDESENIQNLVTNQFIEGDHVRQYKNTELEMEISKCLRTYDRLSSKLDSLTSFLETCKNLKASLPTFLPETLGDSQVGIVPDKYKHDENAQHNGSSLNLEPLSHSLRMSKAARDPSGRSKLLRPSLVSRGAVTSPNLFLKDHTIKTEPEYRRQLADINYKLKQKLENYESMLDKLKKEFSAIEGPQPEATSKPTPAAQTKITPLTHSIQTTKAKKNKRGIYYPEDEDSEEENEEDSFFSSFLKEAKFLKVKTIKVEAFPHKKYENYKGKTLVDFISEYRKKQGLSNLDPQPEDQLKEAFEPAKKKNQTTKSNSVFETGPNPEILKPKPSADNKESSGGIFGGAKPGTTTNDGPSSIFGFKPQGQTDKKTESGSIFGGTKPTEPKKAEPVSIFGANKTQAPAFDENQGQTDKKTASGSIFGGTKPAEPKKAEPVSIFGANKTQAPASDANKSQPASIFGGTKLAEQKAEPVSIFGANKTQAPASDIIQNQAGSISAINKPQAQTGGTDKGQTSNIFGANQKQEEKKQSQEPDSPTFGKKNDTTKNDEDLLETLGLSNKNEEDDLLPPIPLVRDDSFVPKPEPPKMDLFSKTFTGRPDFLKNKDVQQNQQNKNEEIEKLKEFAASNSSQTFTLFSKRLPKENKPEEKKEAQPNNPEREPGLKANNSFLDLASLSNLTESNSSVNGSNQVKQNSVSQSTNLLTKAAQENQAKAENKPGFGNMFGTKPQETGTSNLQGLNFGFQQPSTQSQTTNQNVFQATGTNRFSTGNNPQMGLPGQQGQKPQLAFGATSGPSQSSFDLGHSSSGIAFGRASTGLSTQIPKIQNPQQLSQPSKLFGSDGAFGASNNSAPTGSQGGMLFSSAVQSQGNNSFLGTSANQPNLNFKTGGGMGAMRSTKQY